MQEILPLRHTLHIALYLLFTPNLNLTDLHISGTAVAMLYCPGPCLALLKDEPLCKYYSLCFILLINDHLIVHVAHFRRVVSSYQQQQVDQGMGMATRTLTHTETSTRNKNTFV